MRKQIIFIRHGIPVQTPFHHATWEIDERSKHTFQQMRPGLDRMFEDNVKIYSSSLLRSWCSAKSTYPEKDIQVNKMLDEWEKGREPLQEGFIPRVRQALWELSDDILANPDKNFLIFSHNRFMMITNEILERNPVKGFAHCGTLPETTKNFIGHVRNEWDRDDL